MDAGLAVVGLLLLLVGLVTAVPVLVWVGVALLILAAVLFAVDRLRARRRP